MTHISDANYKAARKRFNRWLHKLTHKKRRIARPGFIVDAEGMRILGRTSAPFLPNLKGMRYEKGKLVPRHS
ncbi:hypothetical protein AAGG42_08275 [Stenotrophomonas maltophilia]|uniref:hypothetical protein n=1 Tax=Stenotrophomonas maltophilia TaxID=40324 RepID=UPI0031453DDF